MALSDIEPADDILAEHMMNLRKSLSNAEDESEEKKELQQKIQTCLERRHQMLQDIFEGRSTDVYPEFEILCEQISAIFLEQRQELYSAITLHSAISATGFIGVTVVRCFAGLEAAFIAALASFVGTNGVRAGVVQASKEQRQACKHRLRKKLTQMKRILTYANDIRFRCKAIETVGLQHYQQMINES